MDTNTGIVIHPPDLIAITRVLIADDEQLFAEALELILQADERIQVIGRARSGSEAIALAGELAPDVVLMDLSMPGLSGFEAIQAIVGRHPGCRVVVLSGSADPDDMAKAEQAGATSYLTKEHIADDLVPRVLAAAAG